MIDMRTTMTIAIALSFLGRYAPGAEPEELLQLRHTPESIALDKEGKRLVVGYDQGSVGIWDLSSDKSARFSLHRREISKVCFSPDGKLAATAGWDGFVRVLDVLPAPDLEVRYRLEHGSPVLSAAFSPDGKLLAVTTFDGRVSVWSLGDKPESRTFLRGNNAVQTVAWSPDGKSLAAGDDEGRIRAFDVASGEEKFQLCGQNGSVFDLSFSPSGDLLAATGPGMAGSVTLWDFVGRKKVASLQGHDAGVGTACVTFSPDGRLLASGGGDGCIAIWDVQKRERRGFIKTKQDVIWQVVFTPDGESILWIAHLRGDQKVFRCKVDAATDMQEQP